MIKRYNIEQYVDHEINAPAGTWQGEWADMVEAEDGEYIKYADYAEVAAEVQALRSELSRRTE